MPNIKEAQVKAKKPKSAPRQKAKTNNLKTFLWLVLFFPAGITLMWRRACSWPRGVKYAVTGLMMSLVVAIMVVPTPETPAGGITLVGARPEVEVYGPELPSTIVSGYTKQTTGSVLTEVVEDDIHYVYAADGAECYHEYKCKFAYASSQRLTVYEAYFLGFKPCGVLSRWWKLM